MREIVSVNVKLTKTELEAFDKAVMKTRRYLNRSDALRQLIREFIESANTQNSVFVDVDGCEVEEVEG